MQTVSIEMWSLCEAFLVTTFRVRVIRPPLFLESRPVEASTPWLCRSSTVKVFDSFGKER